MYGRAARLYVYFTMQTMYCSHMYIGGRYSDTKLPVSLSTVMFVCITRVNRPYFAKKHHHNAR